MSKSEWLAVLDESARTTVTLTRWKFRSEPSNSKYTVVTCSTGPVSNPNPPQIIFRCKFLASKIVLSLKRKVKKRKEDEFSSTTQLEVSRQCRPLCSHCSNTHHSSPCIPINRCQIRLSRCPSQGIPIQCHPCISCPRRRSISTQDICSDRQILLMRN